MPRPLRYSDIAPRIDVDAFEEAIDFSIIDDDGKGNDVGYCPDPWGMHKHGDSTGKFAIHREKKVFNCWVCGGGTLLSLAMAIWDTSEDDTILRLKEFCGEPTDERFEDEISELLRKDERKRNPVLPWFNERVLDNVQGESDILDAWLDSRSISTAVAEEHKVGYNSAAKMIHPSKGSYEGPGIIFPHYWRGKLIGWQTRWLEPDEDRPSWVKKYHNTRDFPKKYTIYNYEKHYLSEDPLVVVESVPTALYLETLGYPSMAVFGGSVPAEQLQLLRSCLQGLILAPDNDSPGEEMIVKATKYLEPYVPLRVCAPVGEDGSGDDLGDLDDPSEAHEAIADAVDLGLL